MKENKQNTGQSPQFYITSVRASEDGNDLFIDYQIPDEFKTWYKQKNNLKRWSRKRFESDLQDMVRAQIAERALAAFEDPDQENPRIRRELLEQWKKIGEERSGSE